MMVFCAFECRMRRVESAFGSQPIIITFLRSGLADAAFSVNCTLTNCHGLSPC